MRGYLFVGGSKDGDRTWFANSPPYYRVPLYPKSLEVFGDARVYESATIEIENYRAQDYYFPERGRFTAYLLESLSEAEALAKVKDWLEIERRTEAWASHFERRAA